MDEKKILSTYIKNPNHKLMADLVKQSIHFSAEEKFHLIKDLSGYTAEQVNKVIKILESEYQANKSLEEKYPEKFKQKKVLAERNWEIVLKALEEFERDN